jgi:hypothetical protein
MASLYSIVGVNGERIFVCSLKMYLSDAFVASTSDVVDVGNGAGNALGFPVGDALGLGFTPNVGTDTADGGI